MELVIVTGFVLIIIGFYWGMKYGRRVRKIKAKRSYQVCLMADEIEWSHPHLHCIIFAFDRSGHLVRKFPEAEMKLSKGQYMLYCIVEEGFLIQFTYNLRWIRYLFLVVFFAVSFLKRKTILLIINKLKNIKKGE